MNFVFGPKTLSDKHKLICVSGIGYILDKDFSFVKIAAPYAQVNNYKLLFCA